MSWSDVKIEGIEDLESILTRIAKIKESFPQEIVKTLSTVRNSILKTTVAGIDVNDQKFISYSAPYMVKRIDNHRQARPVSLTWTGDMLRAMKVFKIADGGEIRFGSTRANNLAVKHNWGKGVPKREFFGLNSENQAYIEKKLIDKVLL